MSKNPFRSSAEPLGPSVESLDSSKPVVPRTDMKNTPPRRSTSVTRHPDSSSSPNHRHHSRPSQDLANHEKLVRKDSRARKQIPRDSIDNLDDILGSYHHEGPFDATLASRQIPGRAPVEATRLGNSMALAATPHEFVQRSLRDHEPLDGISSRPSGSQVDGKRIQYDEENVERRDDEVGRYPGVYYPDSDTENAGEFHHDLGDYQIVNSGKKGEMVEMQGSARGVVEYSEDVDDVDDLKAANRVLGSSSSNQAGILGGLKKRLSIKRHH